MRLTPLFLLLVLALLGLMPVPMAWALDNTQTYAQPQSLPPQLLPPPPEEGSEAWRKQIQAVIKAQRNVMQADHAAMKDEQKGWLDGMTSVLGPTFTRGQLPKTFALLDHVLASVKQVSEADKNFWHTRRPYLTDKNVKLYIDPIDDSPSYPSGHTAGSRVVAEVLGMLVPDKRPVLRARADAIAIHRIEAGVHYPVDIEGGRMLAMLIVGAMVSNDDFQDDLAAARKEIVGK